MLVQWGQLCSHWPYFWIGAMLWYVETLFQQQKYFNILTVWRSGYVDHTAKYSFIQHSKQVTFFAFNTKAQPPPALTATPSVDLNSLTSILLLQMLTNSGLLQSTSSPITAGVAPQAALVPSTVPPVTPPGLREPPPRLPSPTQLKHFLLYAETKLKVRDASQYENELDCRGIRPDVFAETPQHILFEVGIPIGDIICLKKASVTWWNGLGPDAKWKQSGTSSSSGMANHGCYGFSSSCITLVTLTRPTFHSTAQPVHFFLLFLV